MNNFEKNELLEIKGDGSVTRRMKFGNHYERCDIGSINKAITVGIQENKLSTMYGYRYDALYGEN